MSTYTHSRDEIGGPLVETEKPGYELRHAVRHESLYDENDGNDCEVGQFVGVQLRGKLGEDYRVNNTLAGEFRPGV